MRKIFFTIVILILGIAILTGCRSDYSNLREQYESLQSDYRKLQADYADVRVRYNAFVEAAYLALQDPHGLNGLWEGEPSDRDFRRSGPNLLSLFFEFNGNIVTQVSYSELFTEGRITEADIEQGGIPMLYNIGTWVRARPNDIWVDVGELWLRQHGVLYELIGQQEDTRSVFFGHPGSSSRPGNEVATSAYLTTIRESVEGTFSISDDGRVEFVWQDDRGLQVLEFSQTANTIDIGNRRFIRVQ